jgi:hypothetical protein
MRKFNNDNLCKCDHPAGFYEFTNMHFPITPFEIENNWLAYLAEFVAKKLTTKGVIFITFQLTTKTKNNFFF